MSEMKFRVLCLCRILFII